MSISSLQAVAHTKLAGALAVCVYVCERQIPSTCIYIYVCIYVYMYICIYVYMYICIGKHRDMYVCMYTYILCISLLDQPRVDLTCIPRAPYVNILVVRRDRNLQRQIPESVMGKVAPILGNPNVSSLLTEDSHFSGRGTPERQS